MTLRATVNANAADKYDEPWFNDLPPAVQQRHKLQDIQRIDAATAVDLEASTDPWSPAKTNFVAVCARQAKENLDLFARRNKAAWTGEPSEQPPQNPTPDILAEVRRELGITSQPALEQPAAAD